MAEESFAFLALISKSISAWLISLQFLTMLLNLKRHFLYWLRLCSNSLPRPLSCMGIFSIQSKAIFYSFCLFGTPSIVGLKIVQLNSEYISYFVLQLPSPWIWFNWFHSLVSLHSFHLSKKTKPKQKQPKKPPQNQNNTAKTTKPKPKKTPKHPTKTNLLAGIYF